MPDLRIADEGVQRIRDLLNNPAWEKVPPTDRLQKALTAEIATALWHILDQLNAICNAMPRQL